jgi:uncharacterized membrane protein YfcA
MTLLDPTILLMFALVGALAGMLAGLFGIGGGLILIPMFMWAFKAAGFAPPIIVHLAFGTSLAIIIPTAISSALGHRKRGNVDWHLVLRMACGSVVGVACGSSLAAGLSGDTLKGMFGLMQIGVGSRLFMRPPQLPECEPQPASWGRVSLIGFIVGSFAAFFGVGGGVIAVPLIMVLLCQSMHRAVGISSGLMVVSALTGTASYMLHGWGNPQLPPFSLGYVNLLVTLLVAPFTVLMARVGVRIASRTSHARLVKVFAVLIICVGLRMALSAFLP